MSEQTKNISEPIREYKHTKELMELNMLSIKLKLHLDGGKKIGSFAEIKDSIESIRAALESCKADFRLKY